MKKIFVVEDDDGIRELLVFLLQSKNYEVDAFPSIKSFENKILSGTYPDLFLLDIMLPDGNGIDLAKKLKKKADFKHIPVVLMSANADPSEAQIADDFLQKPFDVEALIEKLQQHTI